MILVRLLQVVGARTLSWVSQVGAAAIFFARSLFALPRWRHLPGLLVQQLYSVGCLTVVIVIFAGLFIGMVVALQGFNTLQKFSAESQLGQLLALSITRELGPVVTALLFAGRAGAALSSEIGLMRATDQLSAMSLMAVDPCRQVISPRLWAGILSLPLLTMLFNVVAIYGGFLLGVYWLGVDAGAFWNNMQQAVVWQTDILNGVFKSLVFAIVITWVAVYQGYVSAPNARGVSLATTKTVVYGSLLVLGLDFILTSIMMGGW